MQQRADVGGISIAGTHTHTQTPGSTIPVCTTYTHIHTQHPAAPPPAAHLWVGGGVGVQHPPQRGLPRGVPELGVVREGAPDVAADDVVRNRAL
jgi:hypothetical protein